MIDIFGAQALLSVSIDRPEGFHAMSAGRADALVLCLKAEGRPGEWKKLLRQLCSNRQVPPVAMCLNATQAGRLCDELKLAREIGLQALILSGIGTTDDGEDVLSGVGGGVPLFVMVDGSVGTEEVTRIARHPAVVRMVFQPGRGDGGAGGGDRRASLWAARRRVVSASRLGGLEPPLDAMTPARHRWEDVYQHARSTRALGFGGVLCAAPSQIEPVKAAYAPGQRDVDWANEVLAGKGLTAEEQDAADLRYECRKAIAILSNHAKRDQPTSALGPGSGATKRARLFPGSETCGL